MILYNNNDQQITLPGVRVGAALVTGAQITATLMNLTTNAAVFAAAMTDDILNPGNYVVQPPLFSTIAGTNYQMVYSGKVQSFELTLTQAVEVQDRTH